MKKSFVLLQKRLGIIALVGLATGCSTRVSLGTPDCGSAAYEVTVDSWCGSGCDSYPVSHKMRDTRPESQRVELNGMQQPARCVYP